MRIIIALLLLVPFHNLRAQDVLSPAEFETTGFLSLTIQGTQFHSKFQPVVGLSGGWIVNKWLGVGLKLNLAPPATRFNDLDPEPVVPVSLYGGMLIEPMVRSDDLVHFSFPVSIGWGAILYVKDWAIDRGSSESLKDGDYFKYIEPAVTAELNLLKHIRVALGIGARITSRLMLNNAHPADFSGLNYMLTLKFGRY